MSRRPEKNREKPIKYFDYTMLFIIIFLVGFGLVMLYSTRCLPQLWAFSECLWLPILAITIG